MHQGGNKSGAEGIAGAGFVNWLSIDYGREKFLVWGNDMSAITPISNRNNRAVVRIYSWPETSVAEIKAGENLGFVMVEEEEVDK